MERLRRLAKPADFQRVRRLGSSSAGRLMALLTLANGLEYSRVGFAAGKAVGGAVKRNRAKRLMREAVRAQLPHIAAGWDMVWIARAPLAGAKFDRVQTDLAAQLRRAGLLRDEKNERSQP